MTQPSDAVAAQLALVEEHAVAVRALEAVAVAEAIGTSAEIVRTASVGVAVRWAKDFGDLRAAPGDGQSARSIAAWLRKLLAGLDLNPRAAVAKHGVAAALLGVRQARAEIAKPSPKRLAAPELTDLVLSVAADAALNVGKLVHAARTLVPDEPEHHADLMPAIAAAQHAVARTQAAVMWAVHRELNEGITDVARDEDAELLWIAERDACVHCLAYAGEIASPDEGFAPDLTFGATPLTPWPDEDRVDCPLHPFCRCRVQVWKQARHGSLMAMPDVLKREAERSVLKGWKRPSESEAVRLDAADRLLTRGTNLPKTVRAAARDAVKNRRFASTTVPTGATRGTPNG